MKEIDAMRDKRLDEIAANLKTVASDMVDLKLEVSRLNEWRKITAATSGVIGGSLVMIANFFIGHSR